MNLKEKSLEELIVLEDLISQELTAAEDKCGELEEELCRVEREIAQRGPLK